MATGKTHKQSDGSTLDFEAQLWAAADKMRGHMDTPQCVVQVLVAMLELYKGRVFDRCCGSGGMEEKWKKFVEKGAEVYAKA
jgi:type I restriction enzyme M protein